MRDGLLQQLPKSMDPESALALLHGQLAQATLRFEGVGDGGQFGVALAIQALIEYLSSQGIPYATLSPVIAVNAAIVDARRGIESPIFRPQRSIKGGSPPTPAMQLAFDGILAVVTECCMLQCKQEGVRDFRVAGSQRASRLIRNSAFARKPKASELLQIRDRVRKQREDRPDGNTYWHLINSPVAKARPGEWARLLLKHDWVGREPA